MDEAAYPHTEQAVAQQFGITLFDLRRIRKGPAFPENATAKIGGAIRYSLSALEAVKNAIGVKVDLVVDDPEKTPPAAPQPAQDDIRRLRVERICPNPTWVRARDESGALIDVRVMNNRMMHRDQWIRAIAMPDGKFWMIRERAT